MSGKVSNSPCCDRGRLHVLGVDVDVDPSVGRRLKRGVYAVDRGHCLVMGCSGCSKTQFLLSMIKQHIDCDEGFLVLDSQQYLSSWVLSHIPPEQWDRVVYINPWSAFEDKFDNRVVQLNFLETNNPFEHNAIANMFTDTLEKIYHKGWQICLEDVILNAIYLVLEKENPKLSDVYRVLSDKAFRDKLTVKCKKENLKAFWERPYSTLYKKDALSVLTKLYRLCEDLTVTPMLRTTEKHINFKQAIDENKIIIVDLPKNTIAKDTNIFLGSLILSSIFNAAMSREDTYGRWCEPYYIYVNEAHQYLTRNMPQTLQTIHKYKTYVTLMDQSFDQYPQNIQIPLLSKICKTLITFQVDENTAQTLERHYPKHSHQTLTNLPSDQFFTSTITDIKREYQILQTINHTNGPHNPEEIMRYSLEKYGYKTDVEYLIWQKNQALQQEFINKPITYSEWETLLDIRQHDKIAERKTLLYNNSINSKTTGAKIKVYNQISTESCLENNVYFEDKPLELSFRELEKEKIILKLANEGWYFRLKTVKNKEYLCARKAQEEHSIGQYTQELKYITEKHNIKIKTHNDN
ncbi:MAG: type IV secretory system conjugative DNA transfer family protein [Nitrososphaerota archaeon]|nr:type IV secretory system conjugative DNA transfer family protein [Nitrososphaerota archaeon]